MINKTEQSSESQIPLKDKNGEEALNTKEKLMLRIRSLQDKIIFTPHPLPEKALIFLILKRMPMFTSLLNTINGTGNTLTKLAIVKGHSVGVAGIGFQWSTVVLALIDFFRIPLIYLAAALLGQRLPISLSKNARWLYSTLLLALAIVPLVSPAITPVVTVFTAFLALSVSIFLFIRHLQRYQQIKKELGDVTLEISTQDSNLQTIQNLAADLGKRLESQWGQEDLLEVVNKLESLESSYHSKKQEIQTLYNRHFHLRQKLNKMDILSILDKTVTIALSALACIGLVIALFLPVLGLSVVACTAAAAGFYIIGRITLPLFQAGIDWLRKRWLPDNNEVSSLASTSDNLSLSNRTVLEKLDHEVAMSTLVESTSITMLKLYGEDGARAINALTEQSSQNQMCENLDSQLDMILQQHDLKGIVSFFKYMAFYAQQNHSDSNELTNIFQNERVKQGVNLLQEVIKRNFVSEKDKKYLLSYSPLVKALQELHVDLTQIRTQIYEPHTHLSSLFQEEPKESVKAGRNELATNSIQVT